MTSRRTFIASILAAATPPGFVRAGMPLTVLQDKLNPDRARIMWALKSTTIADRYALADNMRQLMGRA